MTNDIQPIDSFIFYRSFFEAIKYLPKENKAEIYDAICEFALNGNITEFDNPISSGFMHLIKPQLIANQRKRENGLKGAEYGKLGGRPKKEENPKETPNKPLNNPKGTPNVNVNVNDECIIGNVLIDNALINNEEEDKKPKQKKPKPIQQEEKNSLLLLLEESFILETNNPIENFSLQYIPKIFKDEYFKRTARTDRIQFYWEEFTEFWLSEEAKKYKKGVKANWKATWGKHIERIIPNLVKIPKTDTNQIKDISTLINTEQKYG